MPRFKSSLGAVAVSALLCTTALAATPDRAVTTLAESVDAGVHDAQVKRSQKDYAGAIKVLSQLMLIAADDPRVVGEYGKVLVQQGRTGEALDFLNRAVQLSPGDWTLYSALGVAYDQKTDYVSARNAYERALQLKPGESAVLNNYAMSRLQAGDVDNARRLIADAGLASKDERVLRNRDMIYAMKAPAKSATPAGIAAAPMSKTAPKAAYAAPKVLSRPLSPAEGRAVVMQAVPKDALAGPVGKAKPGKKAVAAAKPAGKKTPGSDIPALRLANDGH
jgi:Flp pilus assembly protein TadD